MSVADSHWSHRRTCHFSRNNGFYRVFKELLNIWMTSPLLDPHLKNINAIWLLFLIEFSTAGACIYFSTYANLCAWQYGWRHLHNREGWSTFLSSLCRTRNGISKRCCSAPLSIRGNSMREVRTIRHSTLISERTPIWDGQRTALPAPRAKEVLASDLFWLTTPSQEIIVAVDASTTAAYNSHRCALQSQKTIADFLALCCQQRRTTVKATKKASHCSEVL